MNPGPENPLLAEMAEALRIELCRGPALPLLRNGSESDVTFSVQPRSSRTMSFMTL